MFTQGCIEYERGGDKQQQSVFPTFNDYFMFIFNFFSVEPIHN